MSKIRIFMTQTMHDAKRQNIRIQKIVDEFIIYKETKRPGKIFGRDADFYKPSDAVDVELHHLHLLDITTTNYHKQRMLDQYQRTSDSFLIYCPGFIETNYLLIDIIWQNAHNKINNNDIMLNYSKIAERFRRSK